MDAATRIIIAEIARGLNRECTSTSHMCLLARIVWFLILVALVTLVMLMLLGNGPA